MPFRKIVSVIYDVDLYLLFFAVGFVILNLIGRSMRWALLFPPRERPGIMTCFRLMTMGLAVNGVLPGRPGDVFRIGFATKMISCDFIKITTTLVIERLCDSLTLLFMLLVPFIWIASFKTVGPINVLGSQVDSQHIALAISGLVIMKIGRAHV